MQDQLWRYTTDLKALRGMFWRGAVWWGEATDKPAREDARPTERAERTTAECFFRLRKPGSTAKLAFVKTEALLPAGVVLAVFLQALVQSKPALADGCLAPSFGSARTFIVGNTPQFAVAGDFNNDGRPDLAVANEGGSTISLLLAKSNGMFQAAITVSAGASPVGLAVADLSGDKRLDLAAASSAGISVLLGKSNGAFQAAVNYTAGKGPGAVAVGDFNGDGKPDLAVGNSSSTNVSVLLGASNGVFGAATDYGVASGIRAVAVGDFNNDGKADLAVVCTRGVAVLLGMGDGTFQAAVIYGVGRFPSSVAVGDFNGDGRADLVVANYVSNTISVMPGQGDGTFPIVRNFPTGTNPNSVALGDFNGDGLLDVATANYGSDDASVLLGKGDGTFQPTVNFRAGSSPSSVAVDDFNGDGKPDLAVADYGSGMVSVLLNNCVAPRPSLTVSRSETNAMVSWPFPSAGFALESSTNVAATNWLPASEAPITNGGRREIIAPINSPQRFFRLRKL
ncbi:MAG: VCBS repeat-containing protein [Verrucomicrobia bacterium]|nr:VCBS repeat-containing protein [Verrucomicrobiota bacterium]